MFLVGVYVAFMFPFVVNLVLRWFGCFEWCVVFQLDFHEVGASQDYLSRVLSSLAQHGCKVLNG